jgi:hypothetical protein
MTWNTTIHSQLEKEGYYISYSCVEGRGEETALCIKHLNIERPRYLILTGDHREQYELCKTLKECIDYYITNYHCVSLWDELDLVDTLKDVLDEDLIVRLKDLRK